MINLNSDGQGHFKRLQTPVKQGSNDPTNGLQSPPERGTNDYERPSHTPPIPPIGEGGFGLRADRFEPNKSSHYKHPDNGFVTHHRMFVMSAAGGHEHRERFVCRRHKHASQGQRRCFYTAPSVGLCDSFRYCELAGGGSIYGNTFEGVGAAFLKIRASGRAFPARRSTEPSGFARPPALVPIVQRRSRILRMGRKTVSSVVSVPPKANGGDGGK